MLNGQRKLWGTKEVYEGGGRHVTKGRTWHRVCPSYKNLSAITNNGFVGISFFLFIPVGIILSAGILVTIFVTWSVGSLLIGMSCLPHLWLINRYFDSTPYKWEDGSKINRAENSYLLMPHLKQVEYREFVDALFKGSLTPENAKSLFDKFNVVDELKRKAEEDLARIREQQKIVDEINVRMNLES